MVTTVGPYLQYGEPLVAACAEAGTDYVDLTGEPEFVDRMYLAHHATAERTGARIVHACGFDSIPHDLGAYLHRRSSCRADGPVDAARRGPRRTAPSPAAPSTPAIDRVLARARQMRAGRAERRAQGEPARGPPSRSGRRQAAPGHAARLLAGADADHRPDGRGPQSARRWSRYGPDFSYAHYAGAKTLAAPSAAAAGSPRLGAGRPGAGRCARLLLGTRQARARGPTRRGAQVVVHRRLRRRGRRAGRAHPGLRRRPGLRRDREDAGRVRAVPGLRRQPDHRRAASPRPRRWATT